MGVIRFHEGSQKERVVHNANTYKKPLVPKEMLLFSTLPKRATLPMPIMLRIQAQ